MRWLAVRDGSSGECRRISASYITLDKALNDNGIKLPEAADGDRFGVYLGQSESFHLVFDTDWGSVPRSSRTVR
ncbi:hypothetical protein BWI15_28670 [Kribbella sp. ALI-6-A]|nr:hypothetical protein BWI15_28670 [Kribbella sp. ALI-6-A]